MNIPIIIAVVRQLEEIIAVIRQTAQQQAGIITQGFTVEKNKAINQLVAQCMKVVNVLYVYAFRNNNQQLLSKMSINKRMLYNRHDNEILTLAKNIAAETANHISMLMDYGLESSELDILNENITAFENLISKPQITVGERKIHTENLKQLFSEADSILYDQLDKLVTLFKTSDPDFYNLYNTARQIINTSKRSKKETETKVDTETKPEQEIKPNINIEINTKQDQT
jgi:acetolactate synthase regulatory subunit